MNIPKRVQRGLAWLRAKGPERGLQLSSVVAQLDELDVRQARTCVLGLASGQSEPHARADAYMNLPKPQEWMWRHGFEVKDDDPAGIYDLLTAEWRRALTLEAPF